MDYRKSATEVLAAIGGSQNIASAAHCATRLRLVIVDNGKVDKKTIENIEGVKGVFEASGQLQIIYGTGTVDKVYDEFINVAGISGATKEEAKAAAAANTNVFQRFIKTLGDIFVPIIPAIVASGFLMGIMNALDFMVKNGFLNIDTTSSIYVFANLFSNIAYVFLPILIGFSAAGVFGGNQYLGAVIGMIMIHPNLVNAWNVATATDIPMQSVFFGLWKIKMVGYQGHVIPIMISVWVMSNIEKRLHKVIPAMFDLFATPLISVFVTGYLALSAIGPVFVVVENAFLNAVQMLIAIPFGIGSFIMGALYAPTVVMGIHHMYTIIDLGQIAKYGVTYWLPLASAVNVAQGGACLAVAVKTKDPKIKSLCFPSSLSAFMGITEPAIFGVNLRFFKPFIAGCLGGAVGAMFASIIRLGATGTGVTGIFGILLTLSNPVGYILTFIISMAVAFAASWVLTPSSLIDANLPAEPVEENKDAQALGSVDEAEADKDLRVETKPVEEGPVDVASPLSGKIVSMEETKDETFIAGILGKGVCIIPDKDTVYAPDNGTVIALMGHAVGMKLDNGVELIVHVGVNTVELGGKHFEALVANGDKFKKGQALMKFDSKAISEAGYLMTTPVLVTNSFEYSDVTCAPFGDVAVGDKILTAIR